MPTTAEFPRQAVSATVPQSAEPQLEHERFDCCRPAGNTLLPMAAGQAHGNPLQERIITVLLRTGGASLIAAAILVCGGFECRGAGRPNDEMKLRKPANARMARSSQVISVFCGRHCMEKEPSD